MLVCPLNRLAASHHRKLTSPDIVREVPRGAIPSLPALPLLFLPRPPPKLNSLQPHASPHTVVSLPCPASVPHNANLSPSVDSPRPKLANVTNAQGIPGRSVVHPVGVTTYLSGTKTSKAPIRSKASSLSRSSTLAESGKRTSFSSDASGIVLAKHNKTGPSIELDGAKRGSASLKRKRESETRAQGQDPRASRPPRREAAKNAPASKYLVFVHNILGTYFQSSLGGREATRT